jgi:hypothetical protein
MLFMSIIFIPVGAQPWSMKIGTASYTNSPYAIGIGTLAPQEALHIADSTSIGRIRVENLALPNSGLLTVNSIGVFESKTFSAGQTSRYLNENGNWVIPMFPPDNDWVINTSTSPQTIHSNSDVGIGTISPLDALHVASGSITVDSLASPNGSVLFASPGGKIFSTNFSPDSSNLYLNRSGFWDTITPTPDNDWNVIGAQTPTVVYTNAKVGIGTNAPVLDFQVDGNSVLNGWTVTLGGPLVAYSGFDSRDVATFYDLASFRDNVSLINFPNGIIRTGNSGQVSQIPFLSPANGKFLAADGTWQTPSGMDQDWLKVGGGTPTPGSSVYRWGGVGIGTNNVSEMLTVNGSILVYPNKFLKFGTNNPNTGHLAITNALCCYNSYADFKGNLYFRRQGASFNNLGAVLGLQSDGTVTIGVWEKYNNSITNTFGNKLMVNGGILCEKVKIMGNVPNSDFVFDDGYPLMSISDVKTFIKKNNHLPEIPSAAEFKENGYQVGEMDNLLLRKVEELTLYTIQQEEKIKALENAIYNLRLAMRDTDEVTKEKRK